MDVKNEVCDELARLLCNVYRTYGYVKMSVQMVKAGKAGKPVESYTTAPYGSRGPASYITIPKALLEKRTELDQLLTDAFATESIWSPHFCVSFTKIGLIPTDNWNDYRRLVRQTPADQEVVKKVAETCFQGITVLGQLVEQFSRLPPGHKLFYHYLGDTRDHPTLLFYHQF